MASCQGLEISIISEVLPFCCLYRNSCFEVKVFLGEFDLNVDQHFLDLEDFILVTISRYCLLLKRTII